MTIYTLVLEDTVFLLESNVLGPILVVNVLILLLNSNCGTGS